MRPAAFCSSLLTVHLDCFRIADDPQTAFYEMGGEGRRRNDVRRCACLRLRGGRPQVAKRGKVLNQVAQNPTLQEIAKSVSLMWVASSMLFEGTATPDPNDSSKQYSNSKDGKRNQKHPYDVIEPGEAVSSIDIEHRLQSQLGS
jgi:hypothetical protein